MNTSGRMIIDMGLIQRRAGTHHLDACHGFGNFQPETDNPARAHEVKTNPAIEAIMRIWSDCKGNSLERSVQNHETLERIFARIKSLRYTAKDVHSFSVQLALFQEEQNFPDKSGRFLSALVGYSQEDRFVIQTDHLVLPVNYIRSYNTKNITVIGDAGSHAGFWMAGGTITVEGNAGDCLGMGMRDGSIKVKGNTGMHVGFKMHGGFITVVANSAESVGCYMESGTIRLRGDTDINLGDHMLGGTIIAEGNAGLDVGHEMGDGVIRINGRYESIADEKSGGRIFHKKKLIYPK
jgi:hypothetical protein